MAAVGAQQPASVPWDVASGQVLAILTQPQAALTEEIRKMSSIMAAQASTSSSTSTITATTLADPTDAEMLGGWQHIDSF